MALRLMAAHRKMRWSPANAMILSHNQALCLKTASGRRGMHRNRLAQPMSEILQDKDRRGGTKRRHHAGVYCQSGQGLSRQRFEIFIFFLGVVAPQSLVAVRKTAKILDLAVMAQGMLISHRIFDLHG